MKELNQYRGNLLSRFESIVRVIREAGLKLTEVQWQTKLAGEELTPHQHLARLAARQANEYLPVINYFLQGKKGTMPIFDEGSWMAKDYRYTEKWFEIFESFAGLYEQVTKKLAQIDMTMWKESARHPWHGERTLQWWVEQSLVAMEETLRALEKAGQ